VELDRSNEKQLSIGGNAPGPFSVIAEDPIHECKTPTLGQPEPQLSVFSDSQIFAKPSRLGKERGGLDRNCIGLERNELKRHEPVEVIVADVDPIPGMLQAILGELQEAASAEVTGCSVFGWPEIKMEKVVNHHVRLRIRFECGKNPLNLLRMIQIITVQECYIATPRLRNAMVASGPGIA